jgi:ankyrin repeat protein
MTTQRQHTINYRGAHVFLAALFFACGTISTAGWAGALHDAAETGNLARIQQLVAAGADVSAVDSRGIWPLLAAVTEGNTSTVELLLKLNADPNQEDQYQYSALHEAASLGYHDIMELLIDAKASINARDINGITSLGYALRSSSREAVTLLKDIGGMQ